MYLSLNYILLLEIICVFLALYYAFFELLLFYLSSNLIVTRKASQLLLISHAIT